MVSRKQKKEAALHEKLQQLRSITNSHALSESSIVADATKYIEDLKQRVDTLNQDIVSSQSSSYHHHPQPVVTVETLEKGFLISLNSERDCPGLLVCVLEAFEELGLNVVEANFSCADNFHLQAVGGDDEESEETLDAQLIKQVVSQAINNWIDSGAQD